MILLRIFGLRLAYRGLLRVVVFCKLVKSLGWLVSLERLTYVRLSSLTCTQNDVLPNLNFGSFCIYCLGLPRRMHFCVVRNGFSLYGKHINQTDRDGNHHP